MTKRDFFRTIIKIFGLYSAILTIFSFIPQNIGYVITQFEPIIMIWVLGAITLTVLLMILLIFKADKVIDILKLDKGFDSEEIHFESFNSENLLKLSSIIIGGILCIENFPDFLSHCFYAFKDKVEVKGLNHDIFEYGGIDYFNWAVSGLSILVGYLLLTNYKQVSKWLVRKNVG